jgi:Peptidase family M1 domain
VRTQVARSHPKVVALLFVRTRASLILAAALACDRAVPPAGAAVPEPEAALREPSKLGSIPAAAKVLDWDIHARLDADKHRIDGRARMRWRNTSATTVARMPMHLYMNSFRAEDTPWMIEGRGRHRGNAQGDPTAWGYVDVQRVARRVGLAQGSEGELAPLRFAEGEDPSLMEIELDQPVAPGESIELELEFVTQLPEVFARTGYAGEFHMVGQWYPKPGVLHADGSWHTHPFVFHSEFYADFGDYAVELDVPASMVVGATGIRTEEVVEGDRKRITYHAEMVHDFAWAADPRFVEYTTSHDGVKIRQLMLPEHAWSYRAHEDAQIAALDSMQARFGPYPWSTITIVHPPTGAEGAMGMEYPTLFTTSPVSSIAPPLRLLGYQERVSGVFTTVHEFGHQYFQGLLASDEFAQPWLDEGMNTTSNALVLEDRDGRDAWVMRLGELTFHGSDFVRLSQHGIDTLQPIDVSAAEFSPTVGGYGGIVYRKTAALMLTLRNLAGAAAFDRALHSYAEQHRFGHPTGADLEASLREVIGERVPLSTADPDDPASGVVELDVGDVLEQGLRTTRVVDFRVHAIVNRAAVGDAGWHRNEAGVLVGGDAPEPREGNEGPREAVVVLHRSGDFVIPVEIEVVFDDDSVIRRVWSGRKRVHTLVFPDRKVARVRLDPDAKLVLESRRLDNHRVAHDVADHDDGISGPLGRTSEAAALALTLGVGP